MTGNDFDKSYSSSDINIEVVKNPKTGNYCLKNNGITPWHTKDKEKNIVEVPQGKKVSLASEGRNIALIRGVLQVKVLKYLA